MTDDPPKIASTLELARLGATSFLFFQALLMWQRNHLFAVVTIVGGIAISLILVRRITTELTEVGLSQVTWRGRASLRWRDATEVRRGRNSITVAGSSAVIVLHLESFCDTNVALRYLETHLPRNLGVTGPLH
jgi:hypothetical protein